MIIERESRITSLIYRLVGIVVFAYVLAWVFDHQINPVLKIHLSSMRDQAKTVAANVIVETQAKIWK